MAGLAFGYDTVMMPPRYLCPHFSSTLVKLVPLGRIFHQYEFRCGLQCHPCPGLGQLFGRLSLGSIWKKVHYGLCGCPHFARNWAAVPCDNSWPSPCRKDGQWCSDWSSNGNHTAYASGAFLEHTSTGTVSDLTRLHLSTFVVPFNSALFSSRWPCRVWLLG